MSTPIYRALAKLPKLAAPASSEARETLSKTASNPSLDAAQAAARHRALMYLGLAAGGIGAGGRALLGLKDMLRTKGPGVAMTASVPTTVPVPVFTQEASDDETIAGNLDKAATHPLWTPTGIPAVAATATAGVAGGYNIVDWLLKRRKKQVMQNQLNAAKEQYDNAMKDQYMAAMQNKTAAGNPLPELDDLYDLLVSKQHELQKQADLSGVADKLYQGAKDYVPGAAQLDAVGKGLAGLYLTSLLGTGAIGAYGMYNWTKGRNKDQILRRAMALRARQRYAPQPLYAVPEPTPV